MPKSWSVGLCLATFLAPAAFGQQAQPQPDPTSVIQACRNMLHAEVENSLGSASYSNHWQAKAGELTAKVAELEAKLKAQESPEPPKE
jgi:hypothetical protein